MVTSVRIFCFDEPIFFYEKRGASRVPAWYFRNEVVSNVDELAVLRSVASGDHEFDHVMFRNRCYEGLSVSVVFD